MGRAWHWLWAKRWRRWSIIGFFVFIVGSVVSVEVTSQPHFCSSCHIMGPYYTSWETSAHSDIACVKCHIDPGATSFIEAKLNGLGQVVDDILDRTSTKPSASVTEMSCTRSGCHSTETLNGKQIDNGRFKFRHDKHLGVTHLGVEISCSTCHSHVKGDEHFEVNTSVCITCHMIERDHHGTLARASKSAVIAPIQFAVRSGHAPPPPGSENQEPRPPSTCRTCHDPPTEVIERNGLKVDHGEFLLHGASCESCHHGATLTPQPIEDGRCLQCHTFGIDHSLDATEMHRIHALGKHKIECFDCHGMVQHGPAAQTMTLNQFECQSCHTDQHSAQQRTYLAADDEAVSSEASSRQAINPMFMAHVDCTGCHISERSLTSNPTSGAHVMAASADACDRCHKPGLGAQMVPMWQKTTRDLYAEVEAELNAITSLEMPPEAADLLAAAQELLTLVRIDGSWGVHNPTYTQGLLEQAREYVAQAGAKPKVDSEQ